MYITCSLPGAVDASRIDELLISQLVSYNVS